MSKIKPNIPDYGFGSSEADFGKPAEDDFDWDGLEATKSLGKFNLEEKLLAQFAAVEKLRDLTLKDKTIPVNQKSQVFNSCTQILSHLARLMTEVYNAERLKKFEAALLYTLDQMAPEHKLTFLDAYKEAGVKFEL